MEFHWERAGRGFPWRAAQSFTLHDALVSPAGTELPGWRWEGTGEGLSAAEAALRARVTPPCGHLCWDAVVGPSPKGSSG